MTNFKVLLKELFRIYQQLVLNWAHGFLVRKLYRKFDASLQFGRDQQCSQANDDYDDDADDDDDDFDDDDYNEDDDDDDDDDDNDYNHR